MGGQGVVGSTSPGFSALQHPFSLTKAAAVAAVHRCGKVLQVEESCRSVWGAAALKLFYSAVSPSFESHWYFLIVSASSSFLRVLLACQGGISIFFSFEEVRAEGLALIFGSLSAVFVSRLIFLQCTGWPMKPGIPLSSPAQPLHTQALSCLSRSPASDAFWLFQGMSFHISGEKFLFILYFVLTKVNIFSPLPALDLDTSWVKRCQFDFMTFAVWSYSSLVSCICFYVGFTHASCGSAVAKKLHRGVAVNLVFLYFCFWAIRKPLFLAQPVVFANLFHPGRKGIPPLMSWL